MYLLPTMEEINKLRRAINPTAQIMDYLYSRPQVEVWLNFLWKAKILSLLWKMNAWIMKKQKDFLI